MDVGERWFEVAAFGLVAHGISRGSGAAQFRLGHRRGLRLLDTDERVRSETEGVYGQVADGRGLGVTGGAALDGAAGRDFQDSSLGGYKMRLLLAIQEMFGQN